MATRLSVLLVVLACAPPAVEDPTESVRAMLEAASAAWNRGDLDAFMSDYADQPTTGFVSGGRVQYGFAWIHDNYAPRFMPRAARDSLRFEETAARALGSDHAMATARYVLYRGDSVTASGPFTLVLRRDPERWQIIHDHTSSDP